MEILIEEIEEGFTPERATDGSVGYDLKSRITMTVPPGFTGEIPTGIKLQIPIGYEAQVRFRSGMASKHNITVLNSLGTIDSDYRGEVMVILMNHDPEDYHVKYGDRIAQLVFNKVELPIIIQGRVDSTTRGEDGLGSTGQ